MKKILAICLALLAPIASGTNSYYNHGSFPVAGSTATSAAMRAELDLIGAGFNLFPTLAGHAGEIAYINAAATAIATGSSAKLTSGGALTVASVNGNTITTGTGVLTLGAGKTTTFTSTSTFTGTDAANYTFPGATATIARTDSGQTFTGVQAMTSPAITTSITTPSASFDAFNGTATTLNIGGAATTLNIGAATGTTTIANATLATGASAITSTQTTVALLNATATTVNAFGAATTLNIGGATGTLTVANTTLAAKAGTFSTTLGVTGHTTFEGVTSTGATGTGKLVYDGSPVFTTPNIGSATGSVSGNAGTATTATTATNLAAGSGGTIPYQSAAATTAMLANGTAGQWLMANGTTVAPSWADQSSFVAGSASAVALGGVTGLGTGVATALAVNVGTAGSPVLNGGALGTPSSGSAANLTSFPTLNQNTSGTAAGLSATLSAASGGTGVANNSASTITISGNYASTISVSGAYTYTMPPASSSVGYLNIPQNSQSANYTTVLADSGKHIFHPSTDANARTFTIDSNANVAYAVGTAITFINMTANVVTIAITTDTMYLAGTGTTGSRSLAQYGTATAIKIDATYWIISGTGLT